MMNLDEEEQAIRLSDLYENLAKAENEVQDSKVVDARADLQRLREKYHVETKIELSVPQSKSGRNNRRIPYQTIC